MVAEIPHLRRYARALTHDVDRADDLVQSCLERALGRLGQWRPGSDMRAWLYTIMHNLHRNALRGARRQAKVVPLVAAVAPRSQAPGQELSLEARRVVAAMALLPDDQRDAVLLVGLEQFAYREAAAVLDIPVGTLMSRLHRGRERLRALVAEGGLRRASGENGT